MTDQISKTKKRFIGYLILFLILFNLLALSVNANENNKYGIHLAQPHLEDIRQAAELVNSSGGDWGYITLVIQEDDRNLQKWQEIFDALRKYHLIPIIRLATKMEGNSWKRPSLDEAENWANFLNSLNWVVKERYIVLFNEPNHGAEWGGAVDPYGFADISLVYAQKLKEKNPNFFIMMAGFDASAPMMSPTYQDEDIFLQQVFERINKDDFEKYFDGWSSHSYPNPAFSGGPAEWGRGTVRTYQWELNRLRAYGVSKEMPVFITETGWSDRRLSRETIANYLQYAYENVWLPDRQVQAVTPFIFNYQGEPFIEFSWKKMQNDVAAADAGGNFYPQYYRVQALAKIKGMPERIDNGRIDFDKPRELVANSSYNFKLKIKNDGQAIWDKADGYFLKLEGFPADKYFFSDLVDIKPFEETEVDLHLKTDNTLGRNVTRVVLYRGDDKIIEDSLWNFVIMPLPSLKFDISTYPKLLTEGDDFELQIFDEKENLILKKSGLRVRKNTGYLDNIQNVVLGKKYRIVVLKPYYLPRQEIITFKKKENHVKFERMLPVDFNSDGKLSFEDIAALTKNPKLIQLFFP